MDELQIIADERGLAVFGDPQVVDQFLQSEGLSGRDISPVTVSRALGGTAAAVQSGAQIAAESGQWIKVTAESAEKIKSIGLLTGKDGVVRAVLGTGGKGGIKGTLEVVKTGATLTNPAALMSLSTFMSQMALQQAMDEMQDYLEEISLKVDEILRHQKDAVLADMVGVGFLIDDAIAVRERVGRVSEVTWSKIDNATQPIARTQAYALRQIEELGDRLAKGNVGALAKTAEVIEGEVREWLAVVARGVQLQDGLHVLELERVREVAPDDLEQHRLGLAAAREMRIEHIARATGRLMERLSAAAEKGNRQVLLNPMAAPASVRKSNEVGAPVRALRVGARARGTGHGGTRLARGCGRGARRGRGRRKTRCRGRGQGG